MQDQTVFLVPLEDILVTDRFRTEYDGWADREKIDFLSDSISRNGLLSPLVLDRDGNRLLAGGRRLAALKKLNWTLAPVLYKDQLTNIQRKEIELEENLARKDLTWQETARLTEAIDDLKRTIYGSSSGSSGRGVKLEDTAPDDTGWSLRRTANLRGTSILAVHRDIVLAKALRVLPSLNDEKSASNALRKVDHLVEDLERELVFRSQPDAVVALDSNILHGDALVLVKDLPDNSVDCIITDPPYGFDLEHGRYAARDSTDTKFVDDADSILNLLDKLLPELRRVLKPSGHLYAFFGPNHWDETMNIYNSAGFNVSEIVCIWYKTGPSTGAGDWDHGFAPAWEPFLFCTNRERRLAYKRKNVFEFPTELGDGRYHPTQKPLALLTDLIQLSTFESELVLDPFAGSGSTLVAAKQLNRRYLGFELDDRYVQITKQRLL
jgi:site-specific DNA-methyltransferase (adenine-specific)